MQFKTVAAALRWAERAFTEAGLCYGHGTDNAWDDAVALTLYALNLPTDADKAILQRSLTIAESQQLSSLFTQRIKERIPVPYLTQQAWFCGLPFYVDQRVLIPRSPMAELIMQQFSPWIMASKVRYILDLCSGSACIAVACAYAFPQATVDALEFSTAAIEVAKINLQQHQLTDRVQLLQSDVFSALTEQRYDIIVSNPPYVDADDFSHMPAEFRQEPVLALTSGDDGLDITRRILLQASQYLTAQGILVVEVGNSATTLTAALPQLPLTWLEFANGGTGVFILTKAVLDDYWANQSN